MLKSFLSAIFIILILTILVGIILLFSKNSQQVKNTSPAIIISPTVKPKMKDTNFIVRASIPYWDQANAFDSFKNHSDDLNNLALFWYFLSDDGKITKYQYANEDLNIIQSAKDSNVKVDAVITNLPETTSTTWDSVRVEKILQNKATRASHIAEINNLLNRLNLDGVSIDYELVNQNQRDKFTFFIKELSASLHKNNKTLGVAIHPKTGEAGDRRYLFQDIAEIAKYADRLYLMTYDEHENESSPGPIASVPWVKKVIAYLQSQKVPLNKIILGIPLYGYDWQKGKQKAGDLTFENINALIAKYDIKPNWDETSKSPNFIYSIGEEKHEVWYENADSVKSKINLVKENKLGGVTFWRIGEEDSNIWQILEN